MKPRYDRPPYPRPKRKKKGLCPNCQTCHWQPKPNDYDKRGWCAYCGMGMTKPNH